VHTDPIPLCNAVDIGLALFDHGHAETCPGTSRGLRKSTAFIYSPRYRRVHRRLSSARFAIAGAAGITLYGAGRRPAPAGWPTEQCRPDIAEFHLPASIETLDDHIPDAIVLDIGMPDMDGYDVAYRIRQHRGAKSVQLIALSGRGQYADRRRLRVSGFDHHLTKPAELESLLNILSVPRNDQKQVASQRDFRHGTWLGVSCSGSPSTAIEERDRAVCGPPYCH
jgi:CheY-like chemotaxis protein